MAVTKNIFVIIGSASENSANEKLMSYVKALADNALDLKIFKDLKKIPHFDPDLSVDNPPAQVTEFRKSIETADGIMICTPEYVFSIPAGLKNALEWCVATTLFSGKPAGLITASANGHKGHTELQLIMKTLMARFNEETTLLIQGIRGKINENGQITDYKTLADLERFVDAFKKII